MSATKSSPMAHRIWQDPRDTFRYETKNAYLGEHDLLNRMQLAVAPELAEGTDAKNPWRAKPWLTPIVGSGPLGLPQEFIETAHLLPLAVLGHFGESSLLEGEFQGVGADPEIWIYHFVRNMVDQRVGHVAGLSAFPDPGTHSEDPVQLAHVQAASNRISELTAFMVLASAQLTRLFHEISLDTCRPVSRWGSEKATIRPGHDRWQAVQDEYVDLFDAVCVKAIELIGQQHATPGGTPFAAIKKLLEKVWQSAGKAGGDSTVTIVQLQQLTEVGWHLMVQDISVDSYPGWTDLLLRLVLTNEKNVEQGYKRPRFGTLKKLAEHVRAIVEPPSRRTWVRPDATEDSRRNRDFYDAIARVLWDQSIQRRRNARTHNTSALPRPLAYVTSFDYELEMALWRTAHEFDEELADVDADRKFTVVLPVYATTADDAREGEFLWLEGLVSGAPAGTASLAQSEPEKEDEFDRMRHLDSWRVVGGDRTTTNYLEAPIVIHLAGCPLVDLPSANHPLLVKDLGNLDLGSVTGFEHSVTVDEYLALRQTENEWLWNQNDYDKANRGLPRHLTDAKTGGPRRFWMVMGVPFRDPAVRTRLLSVLAREANSQFMDQPAKAEENPSIGGEGKNGRSKDASTRRKDGIGERARWNGAQTSSMPAQTTVQVVRQTTSEDAEDDAEATILSRNSALTGVAINVRVDDEEAMLLNSIGLAVVTERCEDFAPEIEQYASWLNGFNRTPRQVQTRREASR